MDSLNRHEDYGQEALDETHLVGDPIEQFKIWLQDAEAEKIYEPNAFVLSTVTEKNSPSSRTVLLKGVDEHGFFFATNYDSRKGQAIAANPNVSGVFGWYSMYRQVLIRVLPRGFQEATQTNTSNQGPTSLRSPLGRATSPTRSRTETPWMLSSKPLWISSRISKSQDLITGVATE